VAVKFRTVIFLCYDTSHSCRLLTALWKNALTSWQVDTKFRKKVLS